MDLAELDKLVEKFFSKGLAESTQRTYKCGQRKYLEFCKLGGFIAVPATETVLCSFVAKIAEAGIKHRTIKVYLSAVRFLHIAEGAKDPFEPAHHRLQYVLQGIKRVEAEKGVEKRQRLPISPGILRKMKAVWEADPQPGTTMLWAACCLGFCGFLRSGEMTVPSDSGYDPACHLSRADIAIDHPTHPEVMRVTIKQSKTDPFRQGIQLFIGRTNSDICPVRALLNYLVERGPSEGPLFIFPDGSFLTRQRLVEAVRRALDRAGLNASHYSGHSFRIGAATTAAKKGMEDSVIKTLGRWRSLAYLEYIRIPREQLASYSRILVS